MIATFRQLSLSSSFSRLLVIVTLLIASTVTIAAEETSCISRKATGDDDINRGASFGRLEAIAVGNGVTVAVGTNTILVTTDHKTWVRYRITERYDPKGHFVDVIWDGNRFIALAIYGKIYISDAKAEKWTELSEIQIAEPPPNKVEFRKIRFNKGIYVVLSDSKATNVYLSYGDDALRWKTDRVEGYSHYGPVIQMTWARDRYYIAPSMMPRLKPHLISYQGTQITVELPEGTPFTTAYDDNKFIRAFGSHISHSEDGKSWKKVGSLDNKNYPVRTLRYLNGKYLIGTGCGGFMSSDNGIDWETHQTQSAAFVEEIIWTGKEYLAVGGKYSRGAIFKSPDGKNWKALFERNGDIVVRNTPIPDS